MNSKPYSLFIFLGALGLLLTLAIYFAAQDQKPIVKLPFSAFVSKVEAGAVGTALIDDQLVKGMLKTGEPYEAVIMPSERLSLMMLKQGVDIQVQQQEKQQWSLLTMLFAAFVIGLLGIMIYLRSSGGGMGGGGSNKLFNIGRSKARMFEPNAVKTTFKDVAGLVEAKEELRDIVEFLKNPEKFKAIGAKIPRGVLLNGNPGNGKTLLAKAVAGEANCTFLSINGSDFVEVFVGVGASRVRDLFAQARKHAPCIIFVDEIDAVGRQRGNNAGGGNNDEREQTLNQLLAEMDGFSTEAGSVIVLAATNRADVLDKALVRPGRFDRVVMVPYPDIKARHLILEIHAKNVPLADEVDLFKIARGTQGMSGADLENLINEAALSATKQGKKIVNMEDFELARDKIFMGAARKSEVMSDRVKAITAYHEAGHALVNILLPDASPLHKVTILPRGMALGLTWFFPAEDTEYNKSAAQLRAEIMVAFGGMIAEKITYGHSETGVSSDLQGATSVARRMVLNYGMSSLGPIAFASLMSRGYGDAAQVSEQTAAKIDVEVEKIMNACYAEADALLRANVDKLGVLAKALLEAETMHADEVYALLQMPPRESFSFSPEKPKEVENSPEEEKVRE